MASSTPSISPLRQHPNLSNKNYVPLCLYAFHLSILNFRLLSIC
jgi:hypothetical protein